MAKKIFIDTMIFLHYKAIDGIDLCCLLNVDELVIVIPRITLRELDKHKNIHASKKVRDRAKRIVSKLENWITTSEPVSARVRV